MEKRSFLLVLFLVCLCSQTQAWDSWSDQWDSYGETDLDYYMQQPDPYYDAVCTAKDRCVTTCSANYKKGCVCYNDGSCYEQQVSRCHSCTDPTVFAVFEGKSCPKRHPYICSHSKKSGRFHRGSLPRCSGEKYSSCICSKDGQCTRKKVDLCTLCRSNTEYQAIFFKASCPDTSLKATCNKTFSPLPPPTTCNNPNAYTCTDEDRTSIECNLVSSGVSCVCYQNGTCLSQPSSACACQRPEIVSVTNGSYCPTNCTAESADVAESEEEGEEEEASEAESEAEGEAEAEAESETEAESEEEESSESSLPNITNITNITNVIPAAAAAVPEDRLANVANITNITNITNDTASDADLENENEGEGELEQEEEESSEDSFLNVTNITNVTNTSSPPVADLENEDETENEEASSENSRPNITNITNVTNVVAAPTPAPDNQLANVTNVTNITSATN